LSRAPLRFRLLDMPTQIAVCWHQLSVFLICLLEASLRDVKTRSHFLDTPVHKARAFFATLYLSSSLAQFSRLVL
jgi:hypothetical protein